MDFCLRGSQINLATRQNTKPKYKHNSLTLLHNNTPHFRPRSANFIQQQQQRYRTSPFLGRPQSADAKVGRKLSIYFSEKEFPQLRKNRNAQALSSTDLLKALLEEPIKRSWLTRSAGNSSTDEQSDFGASHKSFSYGSLTKRTRTESADGSSVEGEQYERRYTRNYRTGLHRMPSGSSICNIGIDKTTGYWPTTTTTTLATTTTTAATLGTAKPDLPGRVSFSKASNMHANDIDSSDCDNDKLDLLTAHDEAISAPGPLVLPAYKPESATKKTVHFGDGATGTNDEATGVLAETFEYPKCPSENCTCSTRSSSTASTHDAADLKCACDAPTCRYATTTTSSSSSSIGTAQMRKDYAEGPLLTKSSAAELKVIREYKNAVGDELENTIVKNLLEESKPSKLALAHNIEVPSYLEKYAAPKLAKELPDKQNNLSETKNLSNQQYKTQTKRNLGGADNNLLPELQADKHGYDASSADSVINNYLKVTAATPFASTPKKKENLKPASADMLRQVPAKPKPKPVVCNGATSEMNGKLKKAKSIGSLRDEGSLSEYSLDKVDSWMSINERKLSTEPTNGHLGGLMHQLEKLEKEQQRTIQAEDEANDSGSQYSLKSDDNSRDSTYNEIVSVIKEIDEHNKHDNYAEHVPTSELDLKLDTNSETKQPSTQCDGINAESIKESVDKYKDMLAYLDNVEHNCDKSLLDTRRSIPESNRSEVEFIVEPDIAEDVPKLTDLLMVPNHQLARRVVALSLRANELANAIHLSKENFIQMRNEKQKLMRNEKSQGAAKLRDQKKHFEEIIKRHQGFIEQLLKDKSSLCEKVAALTRRLESQNQAWEHRLDTEVARVKETALAGEKIRRERWVRENTKKIKELTVKGLEAEINRMTCEHQREVTELKRTHQQQLLDALEEARVKHEQIENSIRESCAQDREAIIEKERTAIRERFERQLEEEQRTHDEQKQKLCEEFASERGRLQLELRQKDVEHQNKRQEVQRENESELEQIKFELQEKLSKQEEKYQNRVNTMEKQYMADFEIWKREFENACKVAQVEKENAIRQHYRAERDRQLDELVIRMEADTLQSNEEHEQKIFRLKEKYEKDLADVENVERSLRDKFTDTRTKLAESDAQVRNFQAEIKQMRLELEHSKKMCDDFLNERDQVRENIRNELLNEVSTIKKEHNTEIETLHKRVQQTIGKKDAQIERLEEDNGNLRERCLKLEAVIRQQRKDYCIK